jgi:hypothetical protein
VPQHFVHPVCILREDYEMRYLARQGTAIFIHQRYLCSRHRTLDGDRARYGTKEEDVIDTLNDD